ncbi:BspA family leucine-rich repeat surface protein [Abyssalbus ytuae]|uniref:BspA family leucine-rich repeat surface protein n=1 Tax=Abyssalbus ytuae TaxID=2926907 RepID=A0A9E6ZZF2_9FLAO|nr:BspA family leucine-rich repeat surface protein [Abyssalbus ytuae]UOB16686.1 BspA family leucine-rich repeat surface protein [Abyssalbus ytuae]
MKFFKIHITCLHLLFLLSLISAKDNGGPNILDSGCFFKTAEKKDTIITPYPFGATVNVILKDSCKVKDSMVMEAIVNPIPFITGWNGRTITIPTNPAYTYNYDVDWNNDGIIDQTGITGDVTHTFNENGLHTISISGTFPSIKFGGRNLDIARKIVSINQWGNGTWLSMEEAFKNCINLKINAQDTPDFSNVENMKGMFWGAKTANPDTATWDTSHVTTMKYMFAYAESSIPDVRRWDTANVKDMSLMFYAAFSANPDVSRWDTGNVTDMGAMFTGAISANPDVSKWDTKNVTNMNSMFYGAIKANPDIRHWNISKVRNMENMFFNTALSSANYEKLLIRFAQHKKSSLLKLPENIILYHIPASYCTRKSKKARSLLIKNGWVIKDMGSCQK